MVKNDFVYENKILVKGLSIYDVKGLLLIKIISFCPQTLSTDRIALSTK